MQRKGEKEEQFNPVPVHESEERERIIGERRISYALPEKKEKEAEPG